MTRTIPQLFDDAVARAPDKTWLLHEDDAYTYAQARATASSNSWGIVRVTAAHCAV